MGLLACNTVDVDLTQPMQCCRVFGTAFAEMPFVATREGYRRDGNLTQLVEARSLHAYALSLALCMLLHAGICLDCCLLLPNLLRP